MSLKNSLESEFRLPVRLRAGALGALDIWVNGEKIYSKKQTGRLPTVNQVVTLVRAKLAVE